MTVNLYLGVDGGQTSTKAVIADEQGHVLGRGTGPACDHITGLHGRERNRAAIHGAVRSALVGADIDPGRIVAAGLALTSAPREVEAGPIFTSIVHEMLTPAHVWIDHDVAGNLAGATAGQPGVVVIAGGGSIAYGINADGREGKAGGMGYLMGDDGSAWWIGLQALHAAARAADGRGPETALLPGVLRHFEIATIRHIVGILYAADFRRHQVAELSPLVAGAAESDGVAQAIMIDAGERLASLALATIGQIHAGGEAVDVYPTGGVFQAGPPLTDAFAQALAASWPAASIRRPRFEPVIGALIRAWQSAGLPVTDRLLNNLDRRAT